MTGLIKRTRQIGHSACLEEIKCPFANEMDICRFFKTVSRPAKRYLRLAVYKTGTMKLQLFRLLLIHSTILCREYQSATKGFPQIGSMPCECSKYERQMTENSYGRGLRAGLFVLVGMDNDDGLSGWLGSMLLRTGHVRSFISSSGLFDER